ncbi:MAG: hypothetical protein QM831_08545 [Kofleriaceae bacterium]
MKRLAFVLLAACGSDPTTPSPDAAPLPHELGMNDVSVLVPLPADLSAPVVATLFDPPLLDDTWMQLAVFTKGDLGSQQDDPYDRNSFQITAVRFDICDRATIGPCAAGTDGRLRLVAQPIVIASDGTTIQALDVGVHLFYPIPAADLQTVLTTLRTLRPAPTATALAISDGDAAYFARLRTLVRKYARPDNLVRITANGQKALAVGSTWGFREFDRQSDGSFVQTQIPNANGIEQDILLQGGDVTYSSANPIQDVPAGFQADVLGGVFGMLSAEDKAAAVDAIAQAENPTLHDTVDTQCIACHVGTYIGAYRASEIGLDPKALPSWFTSSFDTTVPAQADGRRIRGFGYFAREPIISQRVANETANVLDEISARFTF